MSTTKCNSILVFVSFFQECAQSMWSLLLFVLNHHLHHHLYHRHHDADTDASTSTTTVLVADAVEEEVTGGDEDNSALAECVVCLNELSIGDKYKTLVKCNHSFHSHCIDTWLNLHSTCPICRSPTPRVVSASLGYTKSEDDQLLLYGDLRSYFLSALERFCRWLADPASQELILAICEDCNYFSPPPFL